MRYLLLFLWAVFDGVHPQEPSVQEPPRPVDPLEHDLQRIQELTELQKHLADQYPDLRNNPELWQKIENRIEQQILDILSSERP